MLNFLLTTLLSLFVQIEYDFVIYSDTIPLNIYWISEDNILLSYINRAEIFNLENRDRNSLNNCTNCIYGYEGEILRCEYIHREIQSSKEFSTTISVYDSKDKLIFQKDLFPTLIPTICKKEYIILKNAYPFLEEKTYILDTKTQNLSEQKIKRAIPKIKGLEYKNISIGEGRIIIETGNNILEVYKLTSLNLISRTYQ